MINAFTLPLSALLLLGGAAGDRWTAAAAARAAPSCSSPPSILCAVAPSLAVFLAGRALQGLGAAMLLPNSLAILCASFTGERRGGAVGTWAAAGAIAARARAAARRLAGRRGRLAGHLPHQPADRRRPRSCSAGATSLKRGSNRPAPDWRGAPSHPGARRADLGAHAWSASAGWRRTAAIARRRRRARARLPAGPSIGAGAEAMVPLAPARIATPSSAHALLALLLYGAVSAGSCSFSRSP